MTESRRRPHVLLSNEHFEVLDENDVVHAKRSAKGFDTLDAVRDVHLELIEVFDRHGRRGRGLLLDLTLAPSRNDAGFEETLAPIRPRILGGWDRCAVLVKSAVGGLQVRRHGREDGVTETLRVLDDPTQARAWAESVGRRRGRV